MSFYYIDQPDTSPDNKTYMSINIGISHAIEKTICTPHHNHLTLEMTYIIKGGLTYYLNQKEYHLTDGDLIIINPFNLHSSEWTEANPEHSHLTFTINLNKWMRFDKSVLTQCYQDIENCSMGFTEFISHDNPLSHQIGQLLLDIHSIFHDKKINIVQCRLASKVYELLGVLFEKCYVALDGEKLNVNTQFVTSVTLFLKENYAKDISTADVAEVLFMSTPKFCTKFRKNFGMTFSNYLCKYRVVRAAEIYKETHMSLQELSAHVGFSDYNYFSKMFKKYMDMSPARYFKKWNPDE